MKLNWAFLFLLAIYAIPTVISADSTTSDKLSVNADVSGCYVKKEMIHEIASKKKLLGVTWLRIKRVAHSKNQYKVVGKITGGNMHICSIQGENGPILMKYKNNSLNYREEMQWEKNKNITRKTCHLRIKFRKNKITTEDVGGDYNCTRYVFSCGVHVSVSDLTFRLSAKKKMKTCDAIISKSSKHK